MNTTQIASLRDDNDFKLAGQHLTIAQVSGIRGEISGKQKQLIYQNIADER